MSVDNIRNKIADLRELGSDRRWNYQHSGKCASPCRTTLRWQILGSE
jgi:hypothetical protein